MSDKVLVEYIKGHNGRRIGVVTAELVSDYPNPPSVRLGVAVTCPLDKFSKEVGLSKARGRAKCKDYQNRLSEVLLGQAPQDMHVPSIAVPVLRKMAYRAERYFQFAQNSDNVRWPTRYGVFKHDGVDYQLGGGDSPSKSYLYRYNPHSYLTHKGTFEPDCKNGWFNSHAELKAAFKRAVSVAEPECIKLAKPIDWPALQHNSWKTIKVNNQEYCVGYTHNSYWIGIVEYNDTMYNYMNKSGEFVKGDSDDTYFLFYKDLQETFEHSIGVSLKN